MKLKKGKRSRKFRGTRYHGFAMKKHKGKGNVGGKGMSGSGKRADQKKTYINKYFKDYFGGEGLKRKSVKLKTINLKDIKAEGKKEVELKNYKILSEGELKDKITIKASAFSEKAKEKIERVGGKAIMLGEKSKEEKDAV